jgi:hypothetical protein
LRLTPAEFDAFLSFLADPQECGLISYEEGQVRASDTDEAYEKVDKKRSLNRVQYADSEPTDNGNAFSDNRKTDSDNRIDTDKTNKTNKTDKLASSRAADDFLKSASERDLADLYAFVLARAQLDPKVVRKSGWAKKVMLDPDMVEEFLASIPKPGEPGREPAPDPCPHCGGKTITPTQEPGKEAEAFCPGCKASWAYDDDFGWIEQERLVPMAAGDEFEDTG